MATKQNQTTTKPGRPKALDDHNRCTAVMTTGGATPTAHRCMLRYSHVGPHEYEPPERDARVTVAPPVELHHVRTYVEPADDQADELVDDDDDESEASS